MLSNKPATKVPVLFIFQSLIRCKDI